MPDPKICLIVSRRHQDTALIGWIKDAFPEAVIYVGKTAQKSPPRLLGDLLDFERRIFPYPNARNAEATLLDLPRDLSGTDLIVDLRPDPPERSLAQQATYGLWYLSPFDTGAVLRGATATVRSLLWLAPGDDTPRRIAEMHLQTKLMVARSQEFALEKAIQLIRREHARLVLTGQVADSGAAPAPPAAAKIADLPRYVWRILKEGVSRLAVKSRFIPKKGQTFTLRYGKGGVTDFDPATAQDVIFPQKGYRADPFLIEHDGATYCFFEQFPVEQAKAHISVARISGTAFEDVGEALRTDYHLSYPSVFKHEGAIYMLPETLGADRLEMWKATRFPLEWTRHAVALEGIKLADAVLFQHQDTWWLLGSPCHDSIGDFSSELWLYRTDGPALSVMEPHPLNPVVVGSDTARGGGRVIEVDGRLLRLSQDNTGRAYGHGLSVMEICEISSTTYREEPIRHTTSDTIGGAIAVHHADFLDGFFVCDVAWP